MTKQYPIGVSDFKKLIQENYYFIDKTALIKEIIQDGSEIIVFTRPRRFGKTINMSMLYYFLQYGQDDLFAQLAIGKDKVFCQQHQNQYPVIFLSFKDIKYPNYAEALIAFKNLLSELYSQYRDFLDDGTLFPENKIDFQNILFKQSHDMADLAPALAKLCKYIKRKFQKKPILIIDEYDTPIHSAYLNGYYQDMINFMRILMGEALKDSKAINKGIVTGITRVSKESLFSDVNNLEVYSLLRKQYAQYFGFTEQEVISLLPPNQMIDPIRSWYNGYRVGDQVSIYNPWSIINCLKNQGQLKPYWNNTSDNALVYRLMNKARSPIKALFEQLIEGKSQPQVIDENLTFGYLENQEGAIWNLLFHTGYLTADRQEFNYGHTWAYLVIPNEEIMLIYAQWVKQWFYITSQPDRYYFTLLEALDTGNVECFQSHISSYIQESGSYFDFSQHTPERVFHVFMLGLLIGLREKYEISSNKEAGLGRYDIIFVPKDPQKQGIILEFKTCEDPKRLNAKAEEALEQIQKKQYLVLFKAKKIASVLLIGMAFCGKAVEVKSEKKRL